MSIKHRIVDGNGGGSEAQVTDYHALVVASVPATASVLSDLTTSLKGTSLSGEDTTIPRYYNTQLSLNGGGVNVDMVGDGSVTPLHFWITSEELADIIINQIVIVLADNTVATNKFGALAALTNGWELKVTQNGVDTFIIEKAKTGGEILVQSGMNNPFGTGGDVNEITMFVGSDDALITTIPLDRYIPGGLRLTHGTTDKITAIVNDNHIGLTQLRVRCIGYKQYI